MGSGVEVHVR